VKSLQYFLFLGKVFYAEYYAINFNMSFVPTYGIYILKKEGGGLSEISVIFVFLEKRFIRKNTR
jgi:hypothetical protein